MDVSFDKTNEMLTSLANPPKFRFTTPSTLPFSSSKIKSHDKKRVSILANCFRLGEVYDYSRYFRESERAYVPSKQVVPPSPRMPLLLNLSDELPFFGV